MGGPALEPQRVTAPPTFPPADSDEFRKLLTTFPFADLRAPHLRGADFTWDFVNYSGLFAPLILDDTVGSGLRVPAPSTTVTDIANTLGESFEVDVIEVATQVRAAAAAMDAPSRGREPLPAAAAG